MDAKVAVVIGNGKIGRAVAEHLRAKYEVVVAGHDSIELRDLSSVEAFFRNLHQVDILINAAGAYGALGTVRSVSPYKWREAGDILLTGVYACCHYALPKMPQGGHIITFVGGGKGPLEMRSGLAAAKSGLGRFNETLAAEESAIHVNAIAPGPMHSKMHEPVMKIDAPWTAQFRRMKATGEGEVPVENSLRVVSHILKDCPTGKLFFARNFQQLRVVHAG